MLATSVTQCSVEQTLLGLLCSTHGPTLLSTFPSNTFLGNVQRLEGSTHCVGFLLQKAFRIPISLHLTDQGLILLPNPITAKQEEIIVIS